MNTELSHPLSTAKGSGRVETYAGVYILVSFSVLMFNYLTNSSYCNTVSTCPMIFGCMVIIKECSKQESLSLIHSLFRREERKKTAELNTWKHISSSFLWPVLFLQPHPISTICIVLSGRQICQECEEQVASVDPTDWPALQKGFIFSSEPLRPSRFELHHWQQLGLLHFASVPFQG